jgi:hypothetical protein
MPPQVMRLSWREIPGACENKAAAASAVDGFNLERASNAVGKVDSEDITGFEAGQIGKNARAGSAVKMAVDDAQTLVARCNGTREPAGEIDIGGYGDLAMLVDANSLNIALGVDGGQMEIFGLSAGGSGIICGGTNRIFGRMVRGGGDDPEGRWCLSGSGTRLGSETKDDDHENDKATYDEQVAPVQPAQTLGEEIASSAQAPTMR